MKIIVKQSENKAGVLLKVASSAAPHVGVQVVPRFEHCYALWYGIGIDQTW